MTGSRGLIIAVTNDEGRERGPPKAPESYLKTVGTQTLSAPLIRPNNYMLRA